jgi:glycosyltransferase involved in cell wall biosynthesis
MALSAIVPTHDRPAELRRCLETLQAQDVAASEFEVVVVDDGSRADIGTVVAQVTAQGPIPMRCERQPLTGLNGARNHGVTVASGDILAFLDDDTLVSRGWASALLRAFDNYPCAGVGGRVELQLAGPEPEWMGELRYYLAAYDLGSESRWLGDDPVPVGANCAVRRADFDRLGGFRRGLDRLAGSLVSNGDTEFFRRLRGAGGRLRYEPGACVIHCIPAERLTVEYFIKRHHAQGVSDELLLRLQGHVATLGHKAGLAREVATAGTAFCKDILRGRDPVRSRFLVSYWAGRLSATGIKLPAE